MFKNYLKIALRNLLRQKNYSLINISGLAIGIACCILILLVVEHELSYDRFHQKAGQIYRVVQDVSWGEGMSWPWTGPPMGPNLDKDFPQVQGFAQFYSASILVSYQEANRKHSFQEKGFAFANSAFLRIFNFPLVKGNLTTALTEPQSVLLTESSAHKYFGEEDPLNKVLRLDNRIDLKVTGVLKDVPDNTHLDFDFLASFSTLNRLHRTPEFTNWWWPQISTYVLLSEKADIKRFNEELLPEFIKRYREPAYAQAIIPRLQPITDIHLYGNPDGNGSIQFVYIFSMIALFVLFIACVNYVNLSTAQAFRRELEVGVRKVVGASRSRLIQQFFGESTFITAIAIIFALVLAEMLLPAFNGLSGKSLDIEFNSMWFWLGLLVILIVVSMLSGIYPALLLSKFAPLQVIKGRFSQIAGGVSLRKALVVFQFAISITLIAGTFVVYNQIDYMRKKNLGFDAEQVIAIPTHGDQSVQKDYRSFKDELLKNQGVLNVSAANWLPGVVGGAQFAFELEGMRDDIKATAPWVLFTGHDFFQTMGIQVAEGRPFSEEYETDVHDAFILNQTAVRTYGLEDPIGKHFRVVAEEAGRIYYEKKGLIIGIIEDFHIYNLRRPIAPTAVTLAENPTQYSHILVRLAESHLSQALEWIRDKWNEHFPHRSFEAAFVDERLEQVYFQEARFGRMIGAFALLAIIIACLGLFGLATFTASQHTKEIGVRKVLGATVTNIVVLLSKDFIKWVLLANIIAWPIAWYAMSKWLQNFAYRINISWLTFVLAGTLALVIALLTVSYQAIRAATANPAEALRYE